MKSIIFLGTILFFSTFISAYGEETTGPKNEQVADFTYIIDQELVPREYPQEVDRRRPVARVIDSEGISNAFIENEVVIKPKNESELQDFLRQYNGTVIRTDVVPEPPPGSNIKFDDSFRKPTEYVVRLDPSTIRIESIKSDAQRLGLGGENRFSSENALKLVALLLRENVNRRHLRLNFLSHGNVQILNSTKERPFLFSNFNAFTISAYGSIGSKANVTRAWQFIRALGVTRRVPLAVIDSGFWLDPTGNPFPQNDLPPNPVQYDFIDNNYVADGPAEVNYCGTCPWHGNWSSNVALSPLNNLRGAAGTGGLVADPMLFKIGASEDEERRAVRTADAWGANVVNLSFGKNCNWFCRLDRDGLFYSTYASAIISGKILVASAGNNGEDATDVHFQPCQIAGVICVGALDDGKNTAISWSNYGSTVNIWAPTNIPVGPDPTTSGMNTVFSGTSASAPFVAGIVAMMRAINPGLTHVQIRQMLNNTAWKDSSDPKVNAYINAYHAVVAAAGYRMPADRFEPNDSSVASTALSADAHRDLTIHVGSPLDPSMPPRDKDHARFSLGEYASVSLKLDYMRDLSKLTLSLGTGGNSCAKLSEESIVGRADGHTVNQSLLSPGDYFLSINSTDLNAYDLTLSLSNVGLPPDAFETNNSLTTPRVLGSGSYTANFHNADDIDYYQINVANSGVLFPYEFRIQGACKPIKLRVFSGGIEINSTFPSLNPKVGLGVGTFVVEVDSQEATPYFCSAKNYKHSLLDKPWYEVQLLPWIDLGDPAPRWLIERQEIYAFKKTSKMKAIRIAGEDLKITLIDLRGNVLAEGLPSRQGTANVATQELSLTKAQQGKEYFIRIERTDFAPGYEDLPDAHTLKRFELQFVRR